MDTHVDDPAFPMDYDADALGCGAILPWGPTKWAHSTLHHLVCCPNGDLGPLAWLLMHSTQASPVATALSRPAAQQHAAAGTTAVLQQPRQLNLWLFLFPQGSTP